MKDQLIKGYQKRTQKDYSLAFKLEIVNAVEKGTHPKASQASLGYSRKVCRLINYWLKKQYTL